MPSPFVCPSCATPLPASGASRCPSCGVTLVGPVAARLWEVDQALTRLRAERAALLEQLRGATTGQAWAPPAAPARTATRVTWTGQQLLLGLGALLVVVAGLVFVAVAWSAVGVLGQVAVLAGLTAGAAVLALALRRRELTASAEALAVVAGAMLVLDVAAARHLGLAGLDEVDDRLYAGLGGLTVAVVLAALHAVDRRVRAWGVGAAVATLVPVAALADAVARPAAGPALPALVALLAAAATSTLLLLEQLRRLLVPAVRVAAGVVAGVEVGLAVLAAAVAALRVEERWTGSAFVREEGLTGQGALGVAVLALAAGGCAAVVAALHRGNGGRAAWQLAVAVAVGAGTTAAVVALVAPGWRLGDVGTATTAVVLAAVLAGVVGAARSGGRSLVAADRWGWAALVLALALGGSVLAAAGSASSAALAVAALAAAAGAAVVAAAERVAAPAGTAAALLLAAVAVVTGADAVTRDPDVEVALGAAGLVLLGWVGAGLAVLAVRRARVGLEVAAGASAAVVLVLAVPPGAERGPGALAAVLAAAGCAVLAHALQRARSRGAVVAAALLAAAVGVLLADAGVELLEAYTLPAAVLALGAGALRLLDARRAGGRATSWSVVGPALLAGLVPSALEALDAPQGEPATRALLVLLAAAAVVLGGVARRAQAPVAVGALVVLAVTLDQLAPVAAGLPRWLTLASLGAVLLAVGVRYEQRRADVRAAVRWVGALR